MKLAKLSLATLIALGAVSAASATPLEEAIKNVDLSGFARYRYDHVSATDTHKRAHKFRMITNFKAAYDDNFYGVLGLLYNSADGSGRANDTVDTTSHFNVREFYLGYKVGGTEVKLGKQVFNSFVTDDLVGTGAVVANSDITGLTLTAFALDAIEAQDSGENDGALWDHLDTISGKYGNVYGLNVTGSYDPVSFQLQYTDVTKLARIFSLEVAGNFEVADDVNVHATAQFAHSAPHSQAKDTDEFAKTNFYGLELGSEFFGAEVNAGYLGWKVKDTKSGSKNGHGLVSLEDQGNYLDAGEQLSDFANDYTYLQGKGNFFYVNAGYTIADQYFVGADYVKGNVKVDNVKTKYDEYVARLGYDYSKKLKFKTYYSYLKAKSEGEKDSSRKIRFEAKYSF